MDDWCSSKDIWSLIVTHWIMDNGQLWRRYVDQKIRLLVTNLSFDSTSSNVDTNYYSSNFLPPHKSKQVVEAPVVTTLCYPQQIWQSPVICSYHVVNYRYHCCMWAIRIHPSTCYFIVSLMCCFIVLFFSLLAKYTTVMSTKWSYLE